MAYVSFKAFASATGLAAPNTYDRLGEAWLSARQGGGTDTFPEFLCREAGYSFDALQSKIAEAFQWPVIKLGDIVVPAEVRRLIPAKMAFQYGVMPVKLEEGKLQVAVSDPFDNTMLSTIHHLAGMPVDFALVAKDEIERALKKYYGVGAETLDELTKDTDDGDEDLELLLGGKEIAEGDQEASVIKFANQVVWEAYKDRATDIHFEPAEDELRIRYRIDGILHQTPMPPQLKQYQASLISRIKVMAGMNIAEKRLPQDGRINVRIKGEEIDIRVSTVPTVYGESVSLRLLTRGRISHSLEKLGFYPEEEKMLREIIVRPHGILLVTGPTGSGKSTSLYGFLNTINSVQKRIITIEEPVEYELKGINQIAVRSDIGLTFAKGLRHILRQDPNVIMVGEIRDLETAEIAIRAALTGHLVMSTLHTNDAPSSFTRLIDMGIEPFLVASSVEAVLAQRLVRTICTSCKIPQEVDRDYLRNLDFPKEHLATAKFWRGAGCDSCRQLGYQGRTGIYELLMVNESIRELVLSRSPSTAVSQRAIANGMRTLRNDGWRKAMEGITTIEEVLRVTQMEDRMTTAE